MCIFKKVLSFSLLCIIFRLVVSSSPEEADIEAGHPYALNFFMYRRPILWTLYGAVDFLKVLKIAVVGGGGGDSYIGSAYNMSLLMMSGIKYWDVMYTLCSS